MHPPVRYSVVPRALLAVLLLSSIVYLKSPGTTDPTAAPAVQAAALDTPTRAEVDAFVAALLGAFETADRQTLGNLCDASSIYADVTGAPVEPLSLEDARRINEMLSYFLLPPNETWSARLLSVESFGDFWQVRIGLIDPHGRINQARVQLGRTAKGVRAVDVQTLASGGSLVELLRTRVRLLSCELGHAASRSATSSCSS